MKVEEAFRILSSFFTSGNLFFQMHDSKLDIESVSHHFWLKMHDHRIFSTWSQLKPHSNFTLTSITTTPQYDIGNITLTQISASLQLQSHPNFTSYQISVSPQLLPDPILSPPKFHPHLNFDLTPISPRFHPNLNFCIKVHWLLRIT